MGSFFVPERNPVLMDSTAKLLYVHFGTYPSHQFGSVGMELYAEEGEYSNKL